MEPNSSVWLSPYMWQTIFGHKDESEMKIWHGHWTTWRFAFFFLVFRPPPPPHHHHHQTGNAQMYCATFEKGLPLICMSRQWCKELHAELIKSMDVPLVFESPWKCLDLTNSKSENSSICSICSKIPPWRPCCQPRVGFPRKLFFKVNVDLFRQTWGQT